MTITLPAYAPGRPAARVDAALRESLRACDRARECAVLWFAEVQRRALYRELGHASLQLYATQAAWVERARTVGRRELEREVRAARGAAREVGSAQLSLAPVSGLAPAQVAAAVPATITLRGDSLQLARFEALVEKARRQGAVAAGADRVEVVLAALEALVERARADAAPAAPTYQVVVQECPTCHAAAAVTARGERPLAPAQVARVRCDARVHESGRPNRATIPPRVRAAVLARDRHRCATPGCGATRFLEIHHVKARRAGGANRPENLVTLCARCHAYAHGRNDAVRERAQDQDGKSASEQRDVAIRPE